MREEAIKKLAAQIEEDVRTRELSLLTSQAKEHFRDQAQTRLEIEEGEKIRDELRKEMFGKA